VLRTARTARTTTNSYAATARHTAAVRGYMRGALQDNVSCGKHGLEWGIMYVSTKFPKAIPGVFGYNTGMRE
jgi:hypothetical protein